MISAINNYFISRFVGLFKRSSCEPLNESVSNDSISDKEEEKEKVDEEKVDEEKEEKKEEKVKKTSSWEDFFLTFF